MSNLNGVISIVPTPLDKNEEIDKRGTERLAQFLCEQHSPLFCLGSAGEGMNLSLTSRLNFANHFCSEVNGQVPILMGAGGFGVKDCMEFIKQLDSHLIAGVHVIPFDSKLSDTGLEKFYRSISDHSPIPIWLYQNTTRHRGIPFDLVAELSQHPNIAGMKLAGFDLRLNQRFASLDSESFQVFGSADVQMFSFFCLGLRASSSSASACFPELFKLLYESFQSNDLHLARSVNEAVMGFIGRLPKGAYHRNGESSAEVKFILSELGICSEHVASPFSVQTESEKSQAREVLATYEKVLQVIKTNIRGGVE